jgi:NodT family efflux transporter outer membrane factor (OMF) lipoprotein
MKPIFADGNKRRREEESDRSDEIPVRPAFQVRRDDSCYRWMDSASPLLLLKKLAPSLLALTLAGCSVGPDYRASAPATPAAWSIDSGRQAGTATWWTTFHDPLLDQLVAQAQARNLDLRLAQARLREIRAQYGVTRSQIGPEVAATGGVNRARTSEAQAQPGVDNPRTTWQAGFDASWEIDIFGGTRRAIEAAGAEVEQEEYRVGDVLVSIVAETVSAYLDLRAADERLAALDQVLSAQAQLRDRVQRRVTAGLADPSELAQAEADLAGTTTRVAPVQVARVQALNRLALVVGELPTAPPGNQPHLLSTPGLHDSGKVPDPTLGLAPGLPSELLLRRPDLRLAERAMAAASARVGVAKSDFFPKFALLGSFGWSAGSTDNLFTAANQGWSIGPSLRWPLFASGRIANEVKAADARLEQAGLRYERVVLQAAGEVENALVRTSRSRERVAAASTALAARERAADLARRRFDRGLADVSSVLEQERLLADARSQLVDARLEQGQALTALAKALGGGWDETFAKK